MTTPLLLSVFPSFAIGGAQIRFVTLVNHLGPKWRHAIVSMDGGLEARERLSPNLNVTFPRPEIRKGSAIGNARRFRAMLGALQPAALLTHNFGSIEWAMANRPQRVRHLHVEDGFGPEERATQLPRRVWLRRILLNRRPVVLPSRTLLGIARSTWRLDPKHLHYIPNGIDLDQFAGAFTPRVWPGAGPVIGTVAALRPEKNLARLIRAFADVTAHAASRLVLVGDGPQRAELEALAATLGVRDRVHFEGHVKQPASVIRSLDIFAMSSDTEQMPISLLEAMAAGRPVVATNVGDIASMLPVPGRSFVTPCDDGALANALLRMIADAPLRQVLGQANRQAACRDFDQADMFARWTALLENTDGDAR